MHIHSDNVYPQGAVVIYCAADCVLQTYFYYIYYYIYYLDNKRLFFFPFCTISTISRMKYTGKKMTKGHNQWGQTYMSLEPIGWTYNQSEQGNVCRKEGINPVGSTANATFLSTKLRNAVVCYSFRDNLPSSLYNTVTIACSTNISGGHLCLPNTSVGSLNQTQPVLDKWL